MSAGRFTGMPYTLWLGSWRRGVYGVSVVQRASTALSKEAIKRSKGGFFGMETGRKLPQTQARGDGGRRRANGNNLTLLNATYRSFFIAFFFHSHPVQIVSRWFVCVPLSCTAVPMCISLCRPESLFTAQCVRILLRAGSSSRHRGGPW